jgi:hypothetical protein
MEDIDFQEQSEIAGGPSVGPRDSVPAEALLEGPIPGQSLTGEPGNTPWESPPEISSPEDAVNFIFDNMKSEENMSKLLGFMTAGVPLEAITKTITFAGFAAGHWTPDVAELIQSTVTLGLLNVALAAGINPTIEVNQKDKVVNEDRDDTSVAKLMKTFKPEEYDNMVNESPYPEEVDLDSEDPFNMGGATPPPSAGFLQSPEEELV